MNKKATDATVTPQDVMAALTQLRKERMGVTAASTRTSGN